MQTTATRKHAADQKTRRTPKPAAAALYVFVGLLMVDDAVKKVSKRRNRVPVAA